MGDALYSGGCRCGAVRYEITAEPLDVTHCHCGICRRAASAPFLTWMALPAGTWTLRRGELRDYRSSENGTRSFCPGCGCHVVFRYASVPDRVFVTAGSLDEPDAVTPVSHSHMGSALRCIHIDDTLPRFEGAPDHG